jgi:DNA polymerase-1
VSTLLGRRRYIPELKASNYNIRQAGERIAMNMPIQGTAADIIKLAMVKIDQVLRQGGYRSRMILQVHDELIIDTHREEEAAVKKLLQENMEQILPLSVPLKVDIASGNTWAESK